METALMGMPPPLLLSNACCMLTSQKCVQAWGTGALVFHLLSSYTVLQPLEQPRGSATMLLRFYMGGDGNSWYTVKGDSVGP